MNVVVYSAGWCNGCTLIKHYLSVNNVDFEERNIDDARHLKDLAKYQIKGIPFTVVNDGTSEFTFLGSSEATVKDLLSTIKNTKDK